MFFLNAAPELKLKNPAYMKAVELYVWKVYELDVGKGDITTRYYVQDKNKVAEADITANANGVLAGMQEAEWFLQKQGIQMLDAKKDGDPLKKGDRVMRLHGPLIKLPTIERALLNLLQRMSGVATLAHRMVQKLPKDIMLLATRKTLWGLLDKRAVALGGGGTHRLTLDDAVMIKDNHLAIKKPGLEFSYSQLIKRASEVRLIEIEVENERQINEWMKIYLKYKNRFHGKKHIVIMLDNFKPSQVKKLAPELHHHGLFVEVSGGITEKNITRYALPGVSAISMGSITMNAQALDISMTLIEPY